MKYRLTQILKVVFAKREIIFSLFITHKEDKILLSLLLMGKSLIYFALKHIATEEVAR